MTMRKQTNKKNLMPLLKRVLDIMLREYKAQFCLVVALILGAALATLRGTLFMRDLVDVYIKPMIGVESPDFGPLAHALLSLALVYLIGLLCFWLKWEDVVQLPPEGGELLLQKAGAIAAGHIADE